MSNPNVVLCYRHLPDSDTCVLDGAAITTVERTVVDIIESHVDEEFIQAIVDDAIDTGSVTRRRLMRRLEELSNPSRTRGERLLAGASK